MWVLLSNVIYRARLCGTCQRSTVPDRFKCLSVPFLNASTGIKLPQSKCELPIWAPSFKFHQAVSVLYCLVFLKAAASLFSFIWHLWIEIFSQIAHNIFPLISLKWTRKLRKNKYGSHASKGVAKYTHLSKPPAAAPADESMKAGLFVWRLHAAESMNRLIFLCTQHVWERACVASLSSPRLFIVL